MSLRGGPGGGLRHAARVKFLTAQASVRRSSRGVRAPGCSIVVAATRLRPDPDDRRRMFVELTPEGLRVLRETRARRSNWLAETLEQELDPRERELLRDALALLDRIAGT